MSVTKIAPDIYSVGVVDWNTRSFHGHTYTTARGTTYNAYLIIDEKITLVDTVYGPFSEELINNIREIIPVERIDNIIINHIETDHSGALPAIHKLVPRAKIFGTEKCKEGLFRHYYLDLDFQVVKTGDKLKIGKRTLSFMEAPMIHWPDSMFTYIIEDEILLSNDAFGQHYASAGKFDDEVDQCELMDEAVKYYANILWPFSSIIFKKIAEIQRLNIPIKMIAPSHGVIWRANPGKIIDGYISWAKNEVKPKVVIAYETMWKSTEKMAQAIANGIIAQGVEVRLFDIGVSDRTEVIKEMLGAKGFIIGSSTHDNGMLIVISGFLDFLKGLKPQNRIAFAFGSYGWAGGAVKDIEEKFKNSGVKMILPGLAVKYIPDGNELKKCYNQGRDFAKKIKEVGNGSG